MSRKRRQYHHGDLRAALLRAALELLDRDGPDAVTIRAVARHAGVSHAAPANHFRDRRALLTALAAGLFVQLGETIELALAKARGAATRRVRVFADTLIEFGLAHPGRYRLLWRRDVLDHDDADLNRAMDAIYDRWVVELAALGPQPHDVHTYAIALWSLAHGYVSMRLDGMLAAKADGTSGEPRPQAIISALLRGIQ